VCRERGDMIDWIYDSHAELTQIMNVWYGMESVIYYFSSVETFHI